MANKIKYGLKNCYYAKQSVSTAGVISYGTPVALPGAKSISLAAEGESNSFYADNVEYFKAASNNGYSGDLELALIPESFYTDILGNTVTSDGVLVESDTVVDNKFALGFEVAGDDTSTLFWFYNCSADRPEAASETRETSISPVTEKLSITCTPEAETGYVRVKTQDTAGTTVRSGWFSAVKRPTTV